MSSPDPTQDPTTDASTFEKHDRVRHPEYGRGYVVSTRGDSCTVFFLEDGKKRDLKQSKLEPTT